MHEHRWKRGRCACGKECGHPEPLDLELRGSPGREKFRWRCRVCGVLDLASDRPLPMTEGWNRVPGLRPKDMTLRLKREEQWTDAKLVDGKIETTGPDGKKILIDPGIWHITVIGKAIKRAQRLEVEALDWSEFWKMRRHRGIEKRREWVEGQLSRDPVLPDWLLATPESELTSRQREALVLVYGYELTQREAARHIGISHTSLRDRIRLAQRKVEAYWGTWEPSEFESDEGDPSFIAPRDEEIDPDHMLGYIWPLIRRQRAFERVADHLCTQSA
jgi:hypothetical protein